MSLLHQICNVDDAPFDIFRSNNTEQEKHMNIAEFGEKKKICVT